MKGWVKAKLVQTGPHETDEVLASEKFPFETPIAKKKAMDEHKMADNIWTDLWFYAIEGENGMINLE